MRPRGSCGSWPVQEAVRLIDCHQTSLETCLLFDLQRIHIWGKLAENFIGLLVELELGGDQISKVAQGFGSIKDLFSISTRGPIKEATIVKWR